LSVLAFRQLPHQPEGLSEYLITLKSEVILLSSAGPCGGDARGSEIATIQASEGQK